MEISLSLQRPLGCAKVPRGETHLQIKPFIGFLPRGAPKFFSWKIDSNKVHCQISANAGYSRRRQRKFSAPKSMDSAPRGFVPRTQLPSSNQRKNHDIDKRERRGTTPNKEAECSYPVNQDLKIKPGKEEASNVNAVAEAEGSDENINGLGLKAAESSALLPIDELTQFAFNGSLNEVDDQPVQSATIRRIFRSEELVQETDVRDAFVNGGVIIENQLFNEGSKGEWHGNVERAGSFGDIVTISTVRNAVETSGSRENSAGRDEGFLKPVGSQKAVANGVGNDFTSAGLAKPNADAFLRLKLESEEQSHKEALEKLAKDNFARGNKLFYHPNVVKPGQVVEIFFSRSLSPLRNEPNVLMMGGFNDWKWRSFTLSLSKSQLSGDWWSCQLSVPKEAYTIDFVFYNGKDIFENNNQKDFRIVVEGGISPLDFENFLLEEKCREQEELARMKAEKERQAEEERRLEAERVAREADKTTAREQAEKKKTVLQELLKKAVISVDNVWYIERSQLEGSEKVLLYYNRSSGPLSQAKEIWIHGGHDCWSEGLSIVSPLTKPGQVGDWWYVEVSVPDRALVLDWVFADGPPGMAAVYDNNNRQDFHAILPKSVPDEVHWAEEEQIVYRTLQLERKMREEAILAKADKTARRKAETKQRTLRRFLLSQKDIVYTDPLDVQAGSTVTVFYNPANTVLNGKPEVWFRCSFNRWTHKMGPLPPQKMFSAKNGSHLKAVVKVPLDAYMMDFVFSEREDGGIFDNKNSMDYHIPVTGVVKEPPLHIVHVAVEMAPIAKVGGLGDVVTSLSRAVQDMNHEVNIILPKYDCLNLSGVNDLSLHKSYSWGGTEIKVWLGRVEGLSVYFLEPQNGLFWAGCIYGRANDGHRFGFFCHAALEFLLQSGLNPDIIHCHDWSSAPVAWLFKDLYVKNGLSNARIVFTIHNLEFGAPLIGKAMLFSDMATTVSPTYSREVSGHPAIAPHISKFHGILNGIDPEIWDPFNDKFIPVSYTSENVVDGKRAAKEALQQRLGLKKADLPVVGIITRLTHQKGIHLIKHAIWRTLERGGQVVLLGSAPDPRIQNDFVNLANQLHSSHHDRARLCLTYDEPLSHLIYAGADFILVPSIFEPCGLTQLTAMRYGSIPVVRKTGGLYDTVFDVDHDKERAESHGMEPNGFSFDGADAVGVDYALNRAISVWYEVREWFNSLCERVMEQDWSWNRPALDYLELYHAARRL